MQISAAVLGAQGRMGSQSAQALSAADDINVVAQLDFDDNLDSLFDAVPSVVLDFTEPQAAVGNVEWCINHAINVVVGTSGFSQERLDYVEQLLTPTPKSSVLIVPNFSIGAVLMMQLAARAAPWFESVEIVEMHHPAKVDAPSGTATRTAEMIAQARHEADCAPAPDATVTDPGGARGAHVDGVHVHAMRGRGFTASQEVVYGNAGELLSIRHDSVDRTSFMPGVVAAVRAMGTDLAPRGLHVGLDSVLSL